MNRVAGGRNVGGGGGAGAGIGDGGGAIIAVATIGGGGDRISAAGCVMFGSVREPVGIGCYGGGVVGAGGGRGASRADGGNSVGFSRSDLPGPCVETGGRAVLIGNGSAVTAFYLSPCTDSTAVVRGQGGSLQQFFRLFVSGQIAKLRPRKLRARRVVKPVVTQRPVMELFFMGASTTTFYSGSLFKAGGSARSTPFM